MFIQTNHIDETGQKDYTSEVLGPAHVRSIRRGQMEPREVVSLLKEIPSRTTLFIKRSLLDDIVMKIKKEFNL